MPKVGDPERLDWLFDYYPALAHSLLAPAYLVIAYFVGGYVYDRVRLRSEARRQLTDDEKAWLGLALPLFAGRKMLLEDLPGGFPSDRWWHRRQLRRSWGIAGTSSGELKESAVAQLEQVRQVGHRGDAAWRQKAGAELGEAEPAARALAAWDCCHLAYLARSCHFVGWLDEELTIYYLRSAAALAREHFADWAGFAEALSAASRIWGPPFPKHYFFARTLAYQLASPQSIWQRYPLSAAPSA